MEMTTMTESLSKREQLTQIYRIRVWYPRMKVIYDEIERAFEMTSLTPEPECIALLGQFRTGKTTLVNSFCEHHPRHIGQETTHVPVLKAVVPAKASMNALLTTLLSALGDPLANRGTMGVKANRLHHLIRDCGVQMVVLDEANHFVDRDSQRVLHDVSNTMKNLVKELNIACVLVGLPYTEEVLQVNEQFGSLFGDPYLLEPFQWDDTQPETVAEFRMFLQQVEKQLPLTKRNVLASRDMGWRCYVATHGKVGYIMRLLRRAAEMAVQQDKESLSQLLLFEAFERTLAGKRRGLTNPFGEELPQSAGPRETEYWPVRRRSGS